MITDANFTFPLITSSTEELFVYVLEYFLNDVSYISSP